MTIHSKAKDMLDNTGVKTIKALILDDSDFDRKRIRRFSEKSRLPILLEEVPSIAAMSARIDTTAYDLILLDYQLGDGDGMDALEIVQGNARQKDAAVIMITGNERADIAITAFRNGVHDFVSKEGLSTGTMRDAVLRAMRKREIRMANHAAGDLQAQIRTALADSLRDGQVQDLLTSGFKAANTPTVWQTPSLDGADMSGFLDRFFDKDEFQFTN